MLEGSVYAIVALQINITCELLLLLFFIIIIIIFFFFFFFFLLDGNSKKLVSSFCWILYFIHMKTENLEQAKKSYKPQNTYQKVIIKEIYQNNKS